MNETTRKKTKPVTPGNMREMALSVIRYLNRNHMFHEVNIYAGGAHYSSDRHAWQDAHTDLVKNITVWAGPMPPDGCPCEYNNPDTLTMTFEGPLYHAINNGLGRGYRAYQELDGIFARYGLYLEMGHAWSMACYPELPDTAKETAKTETKPVSEPETGSEPGPDIIKPDALEPVAYVLSMATNWFKLHIETWQFPDLESARAEMREQLRKRVETDGNPDEAGKYMAMLDDGVEFSNMALSEDKAHIYEDCATIWHCWQITPVMPDVKAREGTA